MLFPIGRSVYNGLQFSLRQDLQNPFPKVKAMNLQVSYALSRYVSTAKDNDFINFSQDNINPLQYIGPNGLDRTHQLSFGGTFDVPARFRVSLIGKAMNLQVSYALSRYVSTAKDNDFINFSQDNINPLQYIGPNGLDRKHQLSFGGTFDVPARFRVSSDRPLRQSVALQRDPAHQRTSRRHFPNRPHRRRNRRW